MPHSEPFMKSQCQSGSRGVGSWTRTFNTALLSALAVDSPKLRVQITRRDPATHPVPPWLGFSAASQAEGPQPPAAQSDSSTLSLTGGDLRAGH